MWDVMDAKEENMFKSDANHESSQHMFKEDSHPLTKIVDVFAHNTFCRLKVVLIWTHYEIARSPRIRRALSSIWLQPRIHWFPQAIQIGNHTQDRR